MPERVLKSVLATRLPIECCLPPPDRDTGAFRQTAQRLGLALRAAGTLGGFDYSPGHRIGLTLYRR